MAVEISQRILDMVRRELVQNPDVDNAVLYDKAVELDPEAMEDVDRRQFNARYPLRVKRFELKRRTPKAERGAGSKPARRRPERKRAAREAKPAPASEAAPSEPPRQDRRAGVRGVLLQFAQDLANADSRGDIVGVVAGVDRYVDVILGIGGERGA